MQKNKLFPLAAENHKIKDYLPIFSFLFVAFILFSLNAFPALYGDEYDSLFDAHHLTGNIHAIGYFAQLYLWSSISNSDWFLRILSILWFGAGLCWLNAWLKEESVLTHMRILIVWLALLNPFLWLYGFQIRFYAMFFATSVLFIWRFRVWEKSTSPRNVIFLAASGVLLLTSHLFGVLVLATALLHYIWTRFSNKRWILRIVLISGFVMILLPPVQSAIIWVVYRMSNPYADIPSLSGRGISIGMLAKVPLTFYFFTLGERIYPLWWWVTAPVMIVMGIAFIFGLWQLRHLTGLGVLTVFMMLNIPLLFWVLDPLAPPGLQGGAPRYIIFVTPYFLLVLALGAQAWKPLKPALIMANLIGLYFLAMPIWSYGSGDFTDWGLYLKKAVIQPQQTCIITDGRGQAPIIRYSPVGVKVELMDKSADCLGFSRIVLVSNDFRLIQVRDFDRIGKNISNEYTLLSNTTFFPAQITLYEKKPAQSLEFSPSRMDLPEQDLHFPITIPKRKWQINGFVRLDNTTPSVTLLSNMEDVGNLWILTNYRAENLPKRGTPTFALRFTAADGSKEVEIILHEGEETASWDGQCNSCASVYEWTKSLHLLGNYAYPGAYSQYQAHIWGYPLNLPSQKFKSLTITYLLSDSTGYFWGIYLGNH